MTKKEALKLIERREYDFLRQAPLGKNIILLGFGGSHAYGTNNENSDIDIRGIATNSPRDILTGHDFECVVDRDTDTTVYSLEKIFKYLCECNPNTIEMLGLRDEDYIHLNKAGIMILENKKIFLSQRAIYKFGGYANAQLRRLQSKSARSVGQDERERYILKSIQNAEHTFKERYAHFPEEAIKLYVDKSEKEGYDTEIFMDVVLKHYPLRDYQSMWNDMKSIVKDYDKVGKRNSAAIEHDKLGKHMTHLIRLYLMCFDILEKGEIVTYREKEHDLLMSIRNGDYLDENKKPIPEFFDMVTELEQKFEYLKTHNDLPIAPDMKEVNDLLYAINSEVVTNVWLDDLAEKINNAFLEDGGIRSLPNICT